MSSDLEILFSKFNNFKQYVKENGTNKEKVELMINQTNDDMMKRSILLLMLFRKVNNIDLIVDTTCKELGLNNCKHKDKVKRYFECFIEYLSIIHKDVIFEDEQKKLDNLKDKLFPKL